MSTVYQFVVESGRVVRGTPFRCSSMEIAMSHRQGVVGYCRGMQVERVRTGDVLCLRGDVYSREYVPGAWYGLVRDALPFALIVEHFPSLEKAIEAMAIYDVNPLALIGEHPPSCHCQPTAADVREWAGDDFDTEEEENG